MNIKGKGLIVLLLTIQSSYITAISFSMGWTTNSYGKTIINYIFHGNDIGGLVTPTFTSCLIKCLNTSGCTHVSYNYNNFSVMTNHTPNWCYLKSNLAITQSQATYLKGYDSEIFSLSTGWLSNGFGQYIVDYDLFGDDIGGLVTATFQDCLSQCANIPGCTHVTYNYNPRFTAQGGTINWCYLKSNPAISQSYATPLIGYQSEILIS